MTHRPEKPLPLTLLTGALLCMGCGAEPRPTESGAPTYAVRLRCTAACSVTCPDSGVTPGRALGLCEACAHRVAYGVWLHVMATEGAEQLREAARRSLALEDSAAGREGVTRVPHDI